MCKTNEEYVNEILGNFNAELLSPIEDTNLNEIRRIHLLFLEKHEKLSDEERACIVKYLNHLSKPNIIFENEDQ